MTKININMIIRTITGIAILLAIFLFALQRVDARQGCCSRHDGVCGCGCCDGTPLSETCAPYYPNCGNTYSSPAPTPVPTPAPTPQPKIETKTEKIPEEIQFSTEQKNDSNLLIGETRVEQEGKNGKKEIAYKVTYTDGKETGREKVSESIVEQPISKIVLVGTKEKEEGRVAGTSASAPMKWWEWLTVLVIFIGIPALIIWGIVKIFRKKRKSGKEKI